MAEHARLIVDEGAPLPIRGSTGATTTTFALAAQYPTKERGSLLKLVRVGVSRKNKKHLHSDGRRGGRGRDDVEADVFDATAPMILSQLHTADHLADDGASTSEDNLFHAAPLVDDSDPDLVIVDDPARPRIKRGTPCQRTSALHHVPDIMAVMVEIPEYDLKQHGEFSGLVFNSTGTGAVVVADFAVAGFLLDDDDVKSLCEEGETGVGGLGRAGTRGGPTASGGVEAAAVGAAVTGGTDRWDFHLASPDQARGSKHISGHPGSAELQPRTKTGKCLLSYTAKLERRVLKVAWHPRSDAHLAILTADREGNTFWELLDLSKEETGNGGRTSTPPSPSSLFVERSASWAKADPVVDFAFLGQQQQQSSSSASGAPQQLWTATSVVFLQRSGKLSSAKVATGSMTFPRNCFSELKQRFHQGTLAEALTTWSGGDPRDGDENSTKPPSSTGEVVVSEPEIIPVTASGDEMCLVQLANGSRGSSSRAARARGVHRAKVPEITLKLRRLRDPAQPIQGPLQDKNKLSRAKQYTQILVVCGNPLPVIALLEREAIEVCTLTEEQCSTPIDVFEGHECFELKRCPGSQTEESFLGVGRQTISRYHLLWLQQIRRGKWQGQIDNSVAMAVVQTHSSREEADEDALQITGFSPLMTSSIPNRSATPQQHQNPEVEEAQHQYYGLVFYSGRVAGATGAGTRALSSMVVKLWSFSAGDFATAVRAGTTTTTAKMQLDHDDDDYRPQHLSKGKLALLGTNSITGSLLRGREGGRGGGLFDLHGRQQDPSFHQYSADSPGSDRVGQEELAGDHFRKSNFFRDESAPLGGPSRPSAEQAVSGQLERLLQPNLLYLPPNKKLFSLGGENRENNQNKQSVYNQLVQQLQIVSKNYVAELIKKNLILKQWLANVGHKMHQHQMQEWGKLREKADEVERNAAELEELTTKLRKRQAELKKELSKIVFGEFGSVGAGDRDQENASPGAPAATAGGVSFTSTGGLVAMVNAEKAKMILDYQLPIRSAAGGIGSDPMLYQQQW